MNLQFVVSNQTNPYLNIAVENYLLAHQLPDTVTMYLWRNHRTVVIGQNQNPYSECDVATLEADGGYLMRRRTGGGAVYHDDGNLNFSFVAAHSLYDQQRQFDVILRAVADYGLHAVLSGRNDIVMDSDDGIMRKFSGNAFCRGRYNNLHHGTILIRGNMADLQRYLRPKPAKLMKHGVDSVRSRVVNLSDLDSRITAESLMPHLRDAFCAVYADMLPLHILDFDTLCSEPDVKLLYNEFASPQWKYGQWETFSAQYSTQFSWGMVELSLNVADGVISDVQVATDALDVDFIDSLTQLLKGAPANVRPPSTDNPMVNDILDIIF